ncbi:BrnT family toxin [Oxalobacteraceae bacterium A2-2]
MRFEWDPAKAAANVRKHGISFEEAATVFDDFGLMLVTDGPHSDDEERFWAIGMSSARRMLLVCHCYRDVDVVRIFSARKAKPREYKLYRGGV